MMGVGGGFIMIPAMVYILGMSTNVVVGTSLFQIIFVTANSTFFQSYLNQTVDIVLGFTLDDHWGSDWCHKLAQRLGTKLRAEYLRGILAILSFNSVCKNIYRPMTLNTMKFIFIRFLMRNIFYRLKIKYQNHKKY